VAQVTFSGEIWYGDVRHSASRAERDLSQMLSVAYYDYEMVPICSDIFEFASVSESEAGRPPVFDYVDGAIATRHIIE